MSTMTGDEKEAVKWSEEFVRANIHLLPQALAATGSEVPGVAQPLADYESPLTHNGIFTVHSLRTGDHRTFKVRTQDKDAKFAPGKRIVSMLTGNDNENSYTQFAFIEEGKVHLWKKFRGSIYERHAWMLEELKRHVADGVVQVLASCLCRVCNRTLTNPESVRSGIGPICDGRS